MTAIVLVLVIIAVGFWIWRGGSRPRPKQGEDHVADSEPDEPAAITGTAHPEELERGR